MTLSLVINSHTTSCNVVTPTIFPLLFTKKRTLSVSEMLNYDTEDETSDNCASIGSLSPRSSTSLLSSPSSSSFGDFELDYEEKVPVVIDYHGLPALKVARRHHHIIKTNKRKGGSLSAVALRKCLNDPKSRKSQGRPFAKNFRIQFLLHDTLFLLLQYNLKSHELNYVGFQRVPFVRVGLEKQLISLLAKRKPHLMEITLILSEIFGPCSRHISAFGNSTHQPVTKTVVYSPKSDEASVHDALRSLVKPFANSLILSSDMDDHGFVFVRVMRSSGGTFLKLESLTTPHQYDSEWLKRKVCFPRYKSNTKVHIFKRRDIRWFGTLPVIIYHDLRILCWDLQNQEQAYFRNKSIMFIP